MYHSATDVQFGQNYAKPQVSLTAPNRDHIAQVSLTVLNNFFWMQLPKLKTNLQINSTESIAQNL